MFRLLAVWLLLMGSALVHVTTFAAPSASEDLSAFKELQQSKWEAQKELQQKDTEALRQQITAVDKRIDDQLTQVGQAVDRFGVLVAVLGVVITVVLVLGGFLGYRNAKAEATAAAKEAATSEAQSSAEVWFKSKAESLMEQIAELEQKAAHAQAQISARVQGVVAHADTRTAEIDAALRQVQESIGDPDLKSTPAQEEAKKTLAERDQELKATNEDVFSFDDWDTRAYAAYAANKLEDAAHFWLKASRVANAGAANVARVLLNRGVTQRQLNELEAAINTYDEVLRSFGDANESALREQVAKALLNKGIAQSQQKQNEAAIFSYNELLRRFGEASDPALLEMTAGALLNRGVLMDELQQLEAAITDYDEVINQSREASGPGMREIAARAMVNKGVVQSKQGKLDAAIATYEEVFIRFGESTEAILQKQVGIALLNKSNVHLRLEQFEEAQSTADKVLTRFAGSSEPALRDLVARASNSAGFTRLLRAKALGPQTPTGRDTLQSALKHLKDAASLSADVNGVILGNRSYVQCLLGELALAENDFAMALRAPVKGGKDLYEATLKDLEICPVREDETMRTLVEQAWLAFNGEGHQVENPLSIE